MESKIVLGMPEALRGGMDYITLFGVWAIAVSFFAALVGAQIEHAKAMQNEAVQRALAKRERAKIPFWSLRRRRALRQEVKSLLNDREKVEFRRYTASAWAWAPACIGSVLVAIATTVSIAYEWPGGLSPLPGLL